MLSDHIGNRELPRLAEADAEIWSDLADAFGLIPEYPPELEELASTNRLQYPLTLLTYVTGKPESAGFECKGGCLSGPSG